MKVKAKTSCDFCGAQKDTELDIKSLPPKHVWVLEYKYDGQIEGGIDVYVTEELARAAARGIVKSYRKDFDVDGDLIDDECVDRWEELSEGDEKLTLWRELVRGEK